MPTPHHSSSHVKCHSFALSSQNGDPVKSGDCANLTTNSISLLTFTKTKGGESASEPAPKFSISPNSTSAPPLPHLPRTFEEEGTLPGEFKAHTH